MIYFKARERQTLEVSSPPPKGHKDEESQFKECKPSVFGATALSDEFSL